MNTRSFRFSPRDYSVVIARAKLLPDQEQRLLQQLTTDGIQKVSLFGDGATSRAFQSALADRVVGIGTSTNPEALNIDQAQAVIIATSPIHYSQVQEYFDKLFPVAIPIYLPFVESEADRILVVVESQPFSGTRYVMSNLLRGLNARRGEIFASKKAALNFDLSADGLLYLEREDANPGAQSYVVKTHFYQPLHFPAYRYVKTLYLARYIFDSYSSWGRLLACKDNERATYRLCANSSEWQQLKAFIPLHQQWFRYTKDLFFLRYEDFFLNFDSTMKRLRDYLGEIGSELVFDYPKRSSVGTFWDDDYRSIMDDEVFRELYSSFHDVVALRWPEKMASLRDRGKL